MKTRKGNERGFLLFESLLALAFFLVLILSSIEFFASARMLFFKLYDTQTDKENALAALEKLRSDVHQAGEGLQFSVSLGLAEGIEVAGGSLILKSAAAAAVLSEEARAGQSVLKIDNGADFTAGRPIFLADKNKGEALVTASVEGNSLILTAPIVFDYIKGEGTVALAQTVSYYLDEDRSTLRRRVNSGIAQPVLEGVQAFAAGLSADGRLVSAGIRLMTSPDVPREMTVVPKNLALLKGP